MNALVVTAWWQLIYAQGLVVVAFFVRKPQTLNLQRMKRVFDFRILDNRVENIVWFIALLLVVWLFKRYLSVLVGKVLYRFFRRYSREDRFTAFKHKILPPLQWLLVLSIMMIGIGLLRFPAAWNVRFMGFQIYAIIIGLLRTALVLAFTWVILRMVDFLAMIAKERAALTESKLDDQLVPFVKDGVKIFIIVFAFLFILGSILRFNIASLIAGVGIGGLAIALAAQESLKNLFASITIFLDKPFRIGDVVTAGKVTGTVENIGFRSTRLRTADKTFVTLPNKVMVDEAVDNLTMRTHRRVNVQIILAFDTTMEQIKSIVDDLYSYLRSREQWSDENIVRFDEFMLNGFRLNITYFEPLVEMDKHMEQREQVNFKIVEIVNRHKASFAKSLHQVELLQTNNDAAIRR